MSEQPAESVGLPAAARNLQSRFEWRVWGKNMVVAALLLAVPAWWLRVEYSTATEGSNRSSCNCRLKQLGLAFHNYHHAYGSFPPAFVRGPDGEKWHSWRVLLLPFLDQRTLYDEYRFDEPWDGPNNRKLIAKMPEIYACPSRPCAVRPLPLLSIGVLACSGTSPSAVDGLTSYAAVFGRDCVMRGEEPVTTKDILDGTSNTLLIGECTRTKIPWTKPEDIGIAAHPTLGDPAGFSGPHAGGMNFLHCDGTVRWMNLSIPQATVNALFTRNGGDLVDDF